MPYQGTIGNDFLPWIKHLPIRMGENADLFDGSLLQIADKNILGMWLYFELCINVEMVINIEQFLGNNL